MKKIIVSLWIMLIWGNAYSTTYTNIADGSWTNSEIWSPAGVPDMSEENTIVNIYHNVTIPLNGQYEIEGTMTIYTGASLFTPNQFRIHGGHVIVWGYLNVHNNLWMEDSGVLEVWYGGFVFVDNKITYSEPSTIYLRGGTICWHNLWKGPDPDGVGVEFNDPHVSGIEGCYSSTGPLGINLYSFNVNCNLGKVKIKWTTENEHNNDHFTIEKSSDLKLWSLVTTYPGSVEFQGRLDYEVTDENVLPGVYYYRISQTDKDGTTTVYDDQWLRYADCFLESAYELYPNPATDILYLKGVTDLNLEVKIIDVYGHQVNYGNTNFHDGKLDIGYLSRGVYFVMTATQKGTKFIKE